MPAAACERTGSNRAVTRVALARPCIVGLLAVLHQDTTSARCVVGVGRIAGSAGITNVSVAAVPRNPRATGTGVEINDDAVRVLPTKVSGDDLTQSDLWTM
jgi:hypothetical protein